MSVIDGFLIGFGVAFGLGMGVIATMLVVGFLMEGSEP